MKDKYKKILETRTTLSLDEGFSGPVKNLSKKIQSKLTELENAAKSNDKEGASKLAADIIDLSTDVRKAITSL